MEGSNSMDGGPKAKPSGRAIASLVLGIASLIIIPIVGFITGSLGVIFGGLELRAIKKGRSSPKGKGIALAGLITGIVGLIVQLMMVAIPIFFNLSKPGVEVRLKENEVKYVAHSVRSAISDYQTQPGKAGMKPASVSEIDSFLTAYDRDKQNPFKENQTYSSSGGGLVDGYPTKPGQVGYVFTDQRVPYKIIALGKDGKPILTLEERQ